MKLEVGNMENTEVNLAFVIFLDNGVWVAHGMEHNVVTHGESLEEIRENIDVIVEAYARTGLGAIPKANAELWAMFNNARKAGRNLDDYLKAPCHDDIYTLELQTA